MGAYKFTSTALSTAAPSLLPAEALRAYPNPSADGHFGLALAAGVQAESYTVFDALGRSVLTRTLGPGAPSELDLSAQAPGLYTLLLRTSYGVARQQLVRQLGHPSDFWELGVLKAWFRSRWIPW